MMVALLVAGIGSAVGGPAGDRFRDSGQGIQFRQYPDPGGRGRRSAPGMMMLGLWMVVRELKNIARRLGAGHVRRRGEVRPSLPPALRLRRRRETMVACSAAISRPPNAPRCGTRVADAAAAAAWQEDRARDRARRAAAGACRRSRAAAKPRRNLLFSSSSRKERERAAGAGQRAVAAGSAAGRLRRPAPVRLPNRPKRRRRLRRCLAEAGARAGGEAPPPRRRSAVATPSTFSRSRRGPPSAAPREPRSRRR